MKKKPDRVTKAQSSQVRCGNPVSGVSSPPNAAPSSSAWRHSACACAARSASRSVDGDEGRHDSSFLTLLLETAQGALEGLSVLHPDAWQIRSPPLSGLPSRKRIGCVSRWTYGGSGSGTCRLAVYGRALQSVKPMSRWISSGSPRPAPELPPRARHGHGSGLGPEPPVRQPDGHEATSPQCFALGLAGIRTRARPPPRPRRQGRESGRPPPRLPGRRASACPRAPPPWRRSGPPRDGWSCATQNATVAVPPPRAAPTSPRERRASAHARSRSAAGP
jgi:hypothetical protein